MIEQPYEKPDAVVVFELYVAGTVPAPDIPDIRHQFRMELTGE